MLGITFVPLIFTGPVSPLDESFHFTPASITPLGKREESVTFKSDVHSPWTPSVVLTSFCYLTYASQLYEYRGRLDLNELPG